MTSMTDALPLSDVSLTSCSRLRNSSRRWDMGGGRGGIGGGAFFLSTAAIIGDSFDLGGGLAVASTGADEFILRTAACKVL